MVELINGEGVVKELKTLAAGLLAGTLLACLAFPAGIESFTSSMAAIFACLLSIAATTFTLRFLRWPRIAVQIRLSFISLGFVACLMSIGLGIFLWRLTLRVSELFAMGVGLSSFLVITCTAAYFTLCYYLLVSARSIQERSPVRLPQRPANIDEKRPVRGQARRKPHRQTALR